MRLIQMIRLGRRRPVAAKQEVVNEIRALRGKLPDVTGVLVASVDGLLVAHDTRGLEPDMVAAMSAAQLGLGQQLAREVVHGEYLENVTRTTTGYVAVFAAGQDGLLALLAGEGLNVGRLHHEARPVAARVGALLTTTRAAANGNAKDRR
jgi:predicted regulator of Ras-like GTPase activity (Roadblock/LC7/MglB family)